jgi:hypothetical protein
MLRESPGIFPQAVISTLVMVAHGDSEPVRILIFLFLAQEQSQGDESSLGCGGERHPPFLLESPPRHAAGVSPSRPSCAEPVRSGVLVTASPARPGPARCWRRRIARTTPSLFGGRRPPLLLGLGPPVALHSCIPAASRRSGPAWPCLVRCGRLGGHGPARDPVPVLTSYTCNCSDPAPAVRPSTVDFEPAGLIQ